MEKAEIVIYKDNQNSDYQIEVRVEDDTVWLTQAQMVNLFDATKQNISLHISNIFREEELQPDSVVKESLTTASDGKKYKTKFYSLDVIISVGYRIKSKRGTQFRLWANKILKDYLLRGHAINNRFENIEKKLYEHDQKFDFIINTGIKPAQGVFFDGQVFDAWQFVSDLIRRAKSHLVLVDNYVDDSVLQLFNKRNTNVVTTIYTNNLTSQLKIDLAKYNQQYQEVSIKLFKKSHDRFLIIDQTEVYHIGASLKDLGKKWFAFSKINLNAAELLQKLP